LTNLSCGVLYRDIGTNSGTLLIIVAACLYHHRGRIPFIGSAYGGNCTKFFNF